MTFTGFNYLFSQKDYKPIKELAWRGLTGEVYFVPFFINTPEGEFEENEIKFYLNELRLSKEWILEQAEDYPQVKLNIHDDYFNSYEEEIFIPDIKTWSDAHKGSNRNVTNEIANNIGFDTMEDYMAFYQIDLKKSKVVILCFVKQSGRSHAYDFNRSIFSEDISIDHTIIFCKQSFGISTASPVITHEVLHLFGAWDLYGGEPQNPEKAKKLAEMYPLSIMRIIWGHKEKTLDEINAWRIGWNLEPKDFYTEYEPEFRKNMNARKKKTIFKFDLSIDKN